MKFIFEQIKRILCPYCLTEIRYRSNILSCPNCKAELPPEYVYRFKDCPPCFVQTIGWSQAGKTVYQQALTSMLGAMHAVWKKQYTSSPQTNSTLRYIRNVNNFMTTGQMPDGTQLTLQEAYILLINGMERWGNRAFVMRDVAGENFTDLVFDTKFTPYLVHVPTVIMMFSLFDLENNALQKNFTIDQLMSAYIQTLIRNNKEYFKIQRNVIIVLSKADLITNKLPSKLLLQFERDPFQRVINIQPGEAILPMGAQQMDDYMNSLAQFSNDIEEWVATTNSGRNLIAVAKSYNIHLRFTLVSSIGSTINNGVTRSSIAPIRVLDPLFWALEFQSIGGEVLDAT